MKRPDRVLSLLGLAAKAGKVASGEFSVEKSVKTGLAYLVIVAGDASDNTKKKFRNSCDFYQVSYLEYSDKESLGRCIGKEYRACVSVEDEKLAQALQKNAADQQRITELNKEGRSI